MVFTTCPIGGFMANTYNEDYDWDEKTDEFIKGYVLGSQGFIIYMKGWAFEYCQYNGNTYFEEEE